MTQQEEGQEPQEDNFASMFNTDGGQRGNKMPGEITTTVGRSGPLVDEDDDGFTPLDPDAPQLDLGDLDEDEEDEDDSKLTPKQLREQLSKVRKEAAKRRVDNKAANKELDEFKKWQASQKTELQRAQERLKELEDAANEVQFERAQKSAARKAGLPADFADRLRGDSDEELLADAKALAKKLGRRSSSPDRLGGTRGDPVGSGAPATGDEWFRDMFHNAK